MKIEHPALSDRAKAVWSLRRIGSGLLSVRRGIVAALLLTAVAGSYADLQRSSQAPRIDAEQQANGSLKRQEAPTDQHRDGALTFSVSSPSASSAIPQSPSFLTEVTREPADAQKSGDETTEYWSILGHKLKITDTLLAVFTLALVVIGWWQGTKLHDAVELSREEFAATHRPWVSVEVSIASNMTFTEHGAQLMIAYVLKNVGTTPAINARFTAHISFGTDNSHKRRDELRSHFSSFRTPVIGGEVGEVIFPGDRIQRSLQLAMGKPELETARLESLKHGNSWHNKILPEIVGCVSYNSSFAKSSQQTGFIYAIHGLDLNRPNVNLAIDCTENTATPMEKMVLSPPFAGGGYAD